MATLYDVCEKTGFSTATISRVINNSGLVKNETREQVLEAIKELNYRPSHAARMLAGRKTDTIGVILPLIDNGYYVQVLRGIDHVSTKENLRLLISFYHSDVDLSETLSALGGEGRTDAIILANNTFLQPEKVRELIGDDLPLVLIGQDHGTTRSTDSVLIDDFHGAYCAVKHLLECEPKSLMLLTGPQDNYDSTERLKGAQKAIQEVSCTMDVSMLHGDFYHEGGRRVFAEHIQTQGTFPDAVFAFNDAMALGVLDVLNDTPKQVPENVQVCGFDNSEIAQYIGLSTVHVPMQQIGEEAGRLAAERIRDQDAKPISVTLKTSLVARKTTASRILR